LRKSIYDGSNKSKRKTADSKQHEAVSFDSHNESVATLAKSAIQIYIWQCCAIAFKFQAVSRSWKVIGEVYLGCGK